MSAPGTPATTKVPKAWAEGEPDATSASETAGDLFGGHRAPAVRHLLSIADLGRDGIAEIMRLSDAFAEVAERPIPKVPALRGRTVATVFMEPSTRTRLSFETAAKRLSADVMTFTASTSAAVKGESLRDTVETIDAMGIDAMVIRHRASGAPLRVTDWVGASVINAGDGTHEHPTQALLDCYTIREALTALPRRRGAGRLQGTAHSHRGRHQALASRPLERARLHGTRRRGGARGAPDAHARVVGGLACDCDR